MSLTAMTTEQVVTASAWGDTYGEANNGAYSKLLAAHPEVHNVRVSCWDMKGAYKCGAIGYITVN